MGGKVSCSVDYDENQMKQIWGGKYMRFCFRLVNQYVWVVHERKHQSFKWMCDSLVLSPHVKIENSSLGGPQGKMARCKTVESTWRLVQGCCRWNHQFNLLAWDVRWNYQRSTRTTMDKGKILTIWGLVKNAVFASSWNQISSMPVDLLVDE